MTPPHIIKLRGGWKVHLDGLTQPWSFPAQTSKLLDKGPVLKFTRRFQSPPNRSLQQQTSLNWAKTEGIKSLILDQTTINLQTQATGSIPISSDQDIHMIEFSLTTNQLTPDQDFGEFWLEITEICRDKTTGEN